MATVAIDRMEVENNSRSRFWCHECRDGVATDFNQESSEIECTVCGGCFVEELDSDSTSDPPQQFIPHEQTVEQQNTSNDIPNPSVHSQGTEIPLNFNNIISQILGGSSRTDATEENNIRAGFIPGGLSTSLSFSQFIQQLQGDSTNPESPSVEVHFGGSAMDATLRSMLGGGTIGNILQVPVSAGSSILAGNPGDYAFGNLRTIINQLMQNDPNQHGTPPASTNVVKNLPDIYISQTAVDCRQECAVCKDLFNLNEQTKQLPCTHLFHPGCILPWLERHNSCPLCRHELPTDDPDYERRRQETQNPPPMQQ